MESESLRTSPAAPNEAPDSNPRASQFSLRALFGLTAIVACLLGIATTLVEKLPLAFGMTAATLSACGQFRLTQTGHARSGVFALAWLVLAVSLVTPAIKGCAGKPVSGWQAGTVCARLGAVALVKAATEPPRGMPSIGDASRVVQLALLNSANLAMIFSPLLLWRLQRGRGARLSAWLAISAVPVWTIAFHSEDEFLIGYYLWAGSFALSLLTFRVSPWLLFAMFVLAVWFCTLPWQS